MLNRVGYVGRVALAMANDPLAGLVSGANASLAAVLREAATTGLAFNHQTGEYWLNGARAASFAALPGATVTRASTGFHETSSGLLVPFAANTLRRTDGVGTLTEAAATNLLLRSQEFDNAAWTKARLNVTANAGTAPDGTSTADALVEDNTTNSHVAFNSVTLAAATQIAFSVYVRRGHGTRNVRLTVYTATHGLRASFDLDTLIATNGSYGTSTFTSASVVSSGGGWFRLTLIGTPSATEANPTCSIELLNGSTVFYAGDGTSSLSVWGAQLETGANATSYIPTTTASATRAADFASVPFARGVPFTVIVVGRATAAGQPANNPNYIDFTRNSSRETHRINMYDGNSTTFQSLIRPPAGGGAARSVSFLAAQPALRAAAHRVIDGENRLCVNGVLSTAGSEVGPTLGDIVFLHNYTGSSGGVVHRIHAIVPRALSDAELQAVTA